MQESTEMIKWQSHIRKIIDNWTNTYMESVFESSPDYISSIEKNVNHILKQALTTEEQRDALKCLLKEISIHVLFSTFVSIDEGIDMGDGTYCILDIVNKTTGKSIIGYSIHEEFYKLMPEGYEPFGY